MTQDDAPLARLIAEEIGQGRMTFADFMERALYHPRLGYYMREGGPRGRAGDYYTSPDLGRLFGSCLARQFGEMWRLLGRPEPFSWVEVGGGRGLLTEDVLLALEEGDKECLEASAFILVEVSPARLKEARRRLLTSPSRKEKVRFVEGLGGWEFPLEGAACFFSNEFLDALPVHRVCQKGSHLWEIYVRQEKGRFYEELGEPSSPMLKSHLEGLKVKPPEGARAEVSLRATEWMKEVGRKLRRGFVLTIDYGYPAKELYSPLRPQGTLLCYYRHTVQEDPYLRVGRQDITAHVDFTSLVRAGREVGLQLTGFTDQLHFLMGLNAPELSERAFKGDSLRARLGLKTLLLPGGLGGTMKVLIQHKGDFSGDLSGLRASPFGTKDGEMA
jgi:SAM-dependent MidA family methyltransferase